MIDVQEVEVCAARFGVPETQIVRDHLISHVIAALAEVSDSTDMNITFFGGTALCRTWLADLRLSEDVDILVDDVEVVDELTRAISRSLRRQFPEHSWSTPTTKHQVSTLNLVTSNCNVKVQLAQWREGWRSIPTTKAAVVLRYSDLPENVELEVPAPEGFAVMKMLAWFDRQTPRDRYDLAALAEAGHITERSIALVKNIAGFRPSPTNLVPKVPQPVSNAWAAELSHQLTSIKSAETCLGMVRNALANHDRTS